MSNQAKTADRILDVAHRLFNENGYSATSIAQIASSVGISPGNLTYHFPSKQDLATALRVRAQATMDSRWESKRKGEVADEYIEHLIFAMRLTWDMRFLFQDQALLSYSAESQLDRSYMRLDFEELAKLLGRVYEQGLFRSDLNASDIDALKCNLWISSRYWMDHLRELRETHNATFEDVETGIRNHLSILGHFLTPAAKAEFETAMKSALRFIKLYDKDIANGTIPSIV